MNRRKFVKSSALATMTMPVLSRAGEPAAAKVIKIGQIGVGHAHAAGKMQVYRELKDDYEVVGIVEPDDRRWESASKSKTYQGLKRLTLKELFAVDGLQAVAVETEVGDLLENAEACIEADMHIHLDKPAGSSLPDYRRIMKTADEKNLTVQMGYMYRYNPAVLLLHKFLEQGMARRCF